MHPTFRFASEHQQSFFFFHSGLCTEIITPKLRIQVSARNPRKSQFWGIPMRGGGGGVDTEDASDEKSAGVHKQHGAQGHPHPRSRTLW